MILSLTCIVPIIAMFAWAAWTSWRYNREMKKFFEDEE